MASDLVKIEKIKLQAQRERMLKDLVAISLDSGTKVLTAALESPGTAMIIPLGIVGLGVRYKQINPVTGGLIAAMLISSAFLDAFTPVKIQ